MRFKERVMQAIDHTIDAILGLDHMMCIDLGQSQMNDVDEKSTAIISIF